MTDRNPTQERQMWLNLLLGFIVWFLYFNLFYPLTSLTCRWGWFQFNVSGVTGLHFVQLVLTATALLLIARLIYLPWRNWRQAETTRNEQEKVYQSAKDPYSLMAFVSMLLNSLFALFIIATFVPMVALHNPCL